MCTNYRTTSRDIMRYMLDMDIELAGMDDWPGEVWKDYPAPILRMNQEGSPECVLASYGIVPRRHIPPGVKVWDTMNARAETVGQLRSFSRCWKDSQLCLIPMTGFFEPNYESGKAVRWQIGMADEMPFAVAGLWRRWVEEDGRESHAFTQLTVNADAHPLMSRFHKPGDEKRSLVVVPRNEYRDWLECRDPERARSFLTLFPAAAMRAWADPLPPRVKKESPQQDLFG
jgi:putative SOS response-associated peptidase YedK